ncbi:hypothetical protein N431DRAFT_549386 [Stipitochalara longipes BDJ]|nr:hypothetical protein N431DRAFT_549386 [Stipitochalara longipes BDJ]
MLNDLHGVEISLCTRNAQRVSLAHLLGLNCMRSLLSSFNWKSEHYKTEHFETLKDCSRELRQSDPAFHNNFAVLLSSECTLKLEIAKLVATEHSWIGLLKDTTTDCAMAAFGDQCLEFKHHGGAACGGIGMPALLTAIVPNELSESPLITKYQSSADSATWASRWEIEKLQVGEAFWLGERGTLRLKALLNGSVLITEWQPSGLKTAVKIFVGKEYPHREYTEIDQSGEEGPKPISVVVISERARASRKSGSAIVLVRGPEKNDARERDK